MGIDELAESKKTIFLGPRGKEVDTEALKLRSKGIHRKPALIYGHLLPHVLTKGDVEKVIVLRCDPSVLRDRLLSRKYASKKVVQNVEAELIGLISSEAFSVFGERKTMEFDTTSTTPNDAVASIKKMLGQRGPKKPRIDWTLNYDTASGLRSLIESDAGSDLT